MFAPGPNEGRPLQRAGLHGIAFTPHTRNQAAKAIPLSCLTVPWKDVSFSWGAIFWLVLKGNQKGHSHCDSTMQFGFIFFGGCSFCGGFSRKHGEGFFRWVHLSCSHESHYKVSLQGIIIMKVIARSHCKESLQGVIARSHGKESLQGVMARSHGKESLQGVIARSHCKESLQGVIARSHGKESLQGVIARSHCKESLQGVMASSHCKD